MFCEHCGSGLVCGVCGLGRDRFRHDLGDMTARFWVWHRGAWVKLSLKPGQCLSHGFCDSTDEGNAWVNESGCVRWCWSTAETDCDGRHADGGELVCRVEHLAKIESRDSDTLRAQMTPDWEIEERYSRDFTAEAAEY